MGKVLAFRRPEERCANCWFYAAHSNNYKAQTTSLTGYCRHPDRTKVAFQDNPVIERLGLHCDPEQWCPKYVNVDSPAMKKLQFVSGIKFVLLCMQRLKSYAAGIEKDEEYGELVNQFYHENRKLMTINQYKATKRDAKYFAALIEETIGYYKQESKNRK
ncbi:MAG TPA: hypothetical protein VMT12_12035 [Syntrophales bacterium]|nr:hypothetical protein [Syntrophales bacterium]